MIYSETESKIPIETLRGKLEAARTMRDPVLIDHLEHLLLWRENPPLWHKAEAKRKSRLAAEGRARDW